MGATYKIFLDKRRKRADNLLPLKLRITINRKHTEKSLDIYLLSKHWNSITNTVKPSHPNHKQLNLKITNSLLEVQNRALEIENSGRVLEKSNIVKKRVYVEVISFGKSNVDELRSINKIGNAIVYECAINKLEEYLKGKKILFEALNFELLTNFSNSMIKEGIKVNTIACYMRTIRALYNKAIDLELVEAKYYPFRKFKILTEKTPSRSLKLDEIKSLLSNSPGINNSYQKLFALSFYLIGMNFADMLTFKDENIVDGRLIISRKKTKKIYSIKLHPKAIEIINQLKEVKSNKGKYVLPFVDSNVNLINQKKAIGLIIHATNDNLKTFAKQLGINKPVSTYYARYTWANIAKGLGYSKDKIAEALGHEYGNKVTGIYLDDFDKEIVDEMNDKVISTVQ